jgi:hypothetical protein
MSAARLVPVGVMQLAHSAIISCHVALGAGASQITVNRVPLYARSRISSHADQQGYISRLVRQGQLGGSVAVSAATAPKTNFRTILLSRVTPVTRVTGSASV